MGLGMIAGMANNTRNWDSVENQLLKLLPKVDQEEIHQKSLWMKPLRNLIDGVIAHFVARILRHCTNLSSFSVHGETVYFPFCERIGKNKDPRPLASFSPSLVKLDIRKWMEKDPTITSRNIIWLLINLPNLQKACFYATLDKEDAKYIEDHSESIKQFKSRVKDLDLEFIDHLSNLRDKTVKEGDATNAIRSSLFCCTDSLTKFGIRYEDFHDDIGRYLDISVLNGLENSFNTLEVLRVEWTKIPPALKEAKTRLLTSFKVLKTFASDQFGFASINRAQLNPPRVAADADYQPFPSSLQEIQMSCNFEGYASGNVPPSETGMGIASELYLVILLEKLPPRSIERVSTSKLPIDHHGRVIDKVFHGTKWRKARKELKKTCAKLGIQLVLVEEEF